MLQITGLSKGYADQKLFEDVNFSVNAGERIGIVGRNGHGKSTLFRLITGQEQPDEGTILISEHYKVGHLSQHLKFTSKNILDEVALALPELDGGWKETYKAEAILQGLGFSQEQFELSPDKLSGGFQIRLNLAKLLVSEPHLLLLDEPTNYLDILSMRWLVRFLNSWPHELLLITHDRGFMDSVTTHTVAIHRSQVRKVAGSTSKVYEQIELEEEIHQKTYENQQKEIEKTEKFIRRFRAKATKASAVQSRIKALDRMDKLESLDEVSTLDFEFNHVPFSGKIIAEVKDLSFGYKKDQLLVKDLSFTIHKDDRIAVIGKNGRGKTTLLNLLAGELKPVAGEVSFSTNTEMSYFGQTNVDRLHKESSIEDEILSVQPERNRTIARSICGAMMFTGDLALKKIGVLSGGEKSRVLLGKVLVSPANLLLLDEPTNHLDMYSHEALIDAIDSFPGALVTVTHSEEMLSRVANRLVVFDDEKVFLFEGGYDDFLRKIGWGDDDSPTKSTNQSGSSLSKKELRKLKADINKRKADEIKPLEKQIKKTEEEIIDAEGRVEEMTAELLEITKNGYGEEASKLSRTLQETRSSIEELYENLEALAEDRSKVEKKYEAELAHVG